METIDIGDPCEVARICPPGLMDVALADIPSDASVFVSPTSEDDSTCAAPPASTLLEELDQFVATLKDSWRKVFDERMIGQKRLREVGDMLGVSSKRVGQLENRVRTELERQPWAKDLRQRHLALLNGRSERLFLDLVEIADPLLSCF